MILQHHTTDVFQVASNPNEQYMLRVQDLCREIDELETQARNLIRQQALAGSELQKIYHEELEQLNLRLKNMKATRDSLQLKIAEENETTMSQQQTLEELADLSLSAFWKSESRYINQVLHRLMGKKRFLLLDGEIIGVATVDRPQRRHT